MNYGGVQMIVFNGLQLIGLAVMVVLLIICGVILVIDRLVCVVKKRSRKEK